MQRAKSSQPVIDWMDRLLETSTASYGTRRGRWVMGSASFAAYKAEGGQAFHRGFAVWIDPAVIGIGFQPRSHCVLAR